MMAGNAADGEEPQGPPSRALVDRTTLLLAAMGTAAGVGCYLWGGADLVIAVAARQAALLLEIIPMIAAGLLVAGFVQALVPKDAIRRLLGGSVGWRSLGIGTLAGMVTPGGPFVSFPLVFVLHRAGADIGTLVAYLTAWSVIGIHRLLIWEITFLGPEYALVRFVASLPLPILAGWLARALASRLRPAGSAGR